MKKLLIMAISIIATGNLKAQVLVNENCEVLTLGNVGTNLDGSIGGQGGWFTDVITGPTDPNDVISNSDFKIIDTNILSYGKAIAIKGSAVNGTTRRLIKVLGSEWADRNTGNNIIEIKFRVYLPKILNDNIKSENEFRMGILSVDNTNFFNLKIQNSPINSKYMITGNYYNGAGNVQPLIPNISYLPQEQTYENFIVNYNYDTGEYKILSSSFNMTVTGQAPPSTNLTSPFKLVFGVSKAPTTSIMNTKSKTFTVDNIEANAISPNLSVDKDLIVSNAFSIIPNPATTIVKICNIENINVSNVIITDINGRIVKQSNNINSVSNVEINIDDLSRGVYIMNIVTSKGTATKKIVKN